MKNVSVCFGTPNAGTTNIKVIGLDAFGNEIVEIIRVPKPAYFWLGKEADIEESKPITTISKLIWPPRDDKEDGKK